MRTFAGVCLGLLLFFPGIVLLQWLTTQVLGLYASMTLTDGCLVMIMILLSVNLMHMRRAARPAASRPHTHYDSSPDYDTPGRLRHLTSLSVSAEAEPAPRRRRPSRRPTRR